MTVDGQLNFLSVFSKAFDIDMCPLPFMLDKMYHFVEVRFSDMSAYVQEQALQWLQVSLSSCYKFITLRPRQDVPLCEGEVL